MTGQLSRSAVFFTAFTAIAGAPVIAQESASKPSRVFYVGNAGNEQLKVVLPLSDGTLLLGGGADNLDWLPPSTPKTLLPSDSIKGQQGTGRMAFLLQVSADGGKPLRCAYFAAGASEGIARIRTSAIPGKPTQTLYVSGATNSGKVGGYFLARLDGNFVDKAPTRAIWIRNIRASGDHRERQPWDVSGDGRVVYAEGEPLSADWCAVGRLTPEGKDDVVPDWRYHIGKVVTGAKAEGNWTPAGARGDVKVEKSLIVFKHRGRSDNRSWTNEEYSAWQEDGNGGKRMGTWPLDAFFKGPANVADPAQSPGGPGYTGYKTGANPTQRIGDIAIDRRSGDMYIGIAIQSRLPDGEPDFEPAVIAQTSTGKLKWWSRLYSEFTDKNVNGRYDDGEPRNSTPDQYVDFLALDYSDSVVPGGALVVGARCHGNNVLNFWNGNKIAARPGAKGFKNNFSGNVGNVHISWLGKLGLDKGTLWAASYVAEMSDTAQGAGAASADPLLDGWPDPNAGWPTLNTTRWRSLSVDGRGRVLVTATGRRVLTTSNAFQKMPRLGQGVSQWSDFVRVYKTDLSGIEYSSLLASPWDLKTGEGGGSVSLNSAVLVPGGIAVVGVHGAYTLDHVNKSLARVAKFKVTSTPEAPEPQALDLGILGQARGAAVPVADAPAWGNDKPDGESGVIGWLKF